MSPANEVRDPKNSRYVKYVSFGNNPSALTWEYRHLFVNAWLQTHGLPTKEVQEDSSDTFGPGSKLQTLNPQELATQLGRNIKVYTFDEFGIQKLPEESGSNGEYSPMSTADPTLELVFYKGADPNHRYDLVGNVRG